MYVMTMIDSRLSQPAMRATSRGPIEREYRFSGRVLLRRVKTHRRGATREATGTTHGFSDFNSNTLTLPARSPKTSRFIQPVRV